ncbi:glyoxalase family protein [Verticillium dahliae]|nr:glyoxalase family protein [Verticillium dahliae]
MHNGPPHSPRRGKSSPLSSRTSIAATAAFYTEELGFTLAGTESDGGEAYFCSVHAGPKAAANIYFFRASPEDCKPGAVMIAVGTAEVDSFYAYLRGRPAVKVVEEIEDKPWEYRQFSILDPDGNRLTFFRFLEGGNPGTECLRTVL